MAKKKQIKMSRDIYETLHFASLMFGGIGAGKLYENGGIFGNPQSVPYCTHGMLNVSVDAQDYIGSEHPSMRARNLGIDTTTSDKAVIAINKRNTDPFKYPFYDARVSFEEWVAELGIVPDDKGVIYGEDFIA